MILIIMRRFLSRAHIAYHVPVQYSLSHVRATFYYRGITSVTWGGTRNSLAIQGNTLTYKESIGYKETLEYTREPCNIQGGHLISKEILQYERKPLSIP